MKRPPVRFLIVWANLAGLLALALAYPDLMVSPGPLVPGHAEIASTCSACHTLWRGPSSGRCIECHPLAEVGLRTTKGDKIVAGTIKGSFHQELIEQDCITCHSDHLGPRLARGSRKRFSHELFKETVQGRCAVCHAAPPDTLHSDLKVECGQCHQVRAWKPAHFDHALLDRPARDRCESCHRAPTDGLHRQIPGSCSSCHQTEAWKPATFEHGRYFVLDRDHQATCVTCHEKGDYARYTCYGCHEHSPARVQSQHDEEGIRDLANCVRCHRSARGEHGEGGRGD